MGYYCTVPQCTSLAGKTKNVKFHRFPRDETMADKWNIILKRGKPYTKYSKVCSLHFTQADYNVTTLGTMKTLSKDAVPTQNLPKLNADGTVMVIRKARTIKPKQEHIYVKTEGESGCDTKMDWQTATMSGHLSPDQSTSSNSHHCNDTNDILHYNRLTGLSKIASTMSPLAVSTPKSLVKPEDYLPMLNRNGFHHPGELLYQKNADLYTKISYKPSDYQNEYSKYPTYLRSSYENGADYSKINYGKTPEESFSSGDKDGDSEKSESFAYRKEYYDGESNNISIVQNGDYFPNPIKEEVDEVYNESPMSKEDSRYTVESNSDLIKPRYIGEQQIQDTALLLQQQQRLMDFYDKQDKIKTEPDSSRVNENGAPSDGVTSPLPSYYRRELPSETSAGYYHQERDGDVVTENQQLASHYAQQEQMFSTQPGPEMLISKQNALTAHTALWQNTVKRPFFYSDSQQYNPSLIRYN